MVDAYEPSTAAVLTNAAAKLANYSYQVQKEGAPQAPPAPYYGQRHRQRKRSPISPKTMVVQQMLEVEAILKSLKPSVSSTPSMEPIETPIKTLQSGAPTALGKSIDDELREQLMNLQAKQEAGEDLLPKEEAKPKWSKRSRKTPSLSIETSPAVTPPRVASKEPSPVGDELQIMYLDDLDDNDLVFVEDAFSPGHESPNLEQKSPKRRFYPQPETMPISPGFVSPSTKLTVTPPWSPLPADKDDESMSAQHSLSSSIAPSRNDTTSRLRTHPINETVNQLLRSTECKMMLCQLEKRKDQIGLRKRLQLSLFFNNTLACIQDIQSAAALGGRHSHAALDQLDDIAQRLSTKPDIANNREGRDRR